MMAVHSVAYLTLLAAVCGWVVCAGGWMGGQAKEKATGIIYAVKRSKKMLESRHERWVLALLAS
jgi:hypothetical protein